MFQIDTSAEEEFKKKKLLVKRKQNKATSSFQK